MSVKRINPGPRMSGVVVHNGVAYLAGQVPSSKQGDIGEQTADVLRTIDKLLAEAGTSKANLLRAEIFLTDMNDFAGMNKVWDAWVVPGHTPPRATVLAGMINPEWKVEIVVTAAL